MENMILFSIIYYNLLAAWDFEKHKIKATVTVNAVQDISKICGGREMYYF